MPYTEEFAIGFLIFTFWTATAFLSVGLLNASIDAPDAGNARYLRQPYNCSPYVSPYEAREPKIHIRR